MKNIDLQGLIDDFQLDKGAADTLAGCVLQAVTAQVVENVHLVSGQKLRSTRARYHQAISIAGAGPFCNIVYLADPLANMLESGATAMDLKTAMLRGPRVKFTKDGKPYLTVPFRHGTPGSLAENAAFSGKMPPEVYNAAKKLAAYQSMPGGAKQAGAPLVLVPAPYNAPKTRAQLTQNIGSLSPQQLAAYQHQGSIYAGLQRQQKTYESATQSSYVTFRRVSLGSAVNAWIHPGLPAGNFFEAGLALTDIDHVAGIAAENTLHALGLL